jgi:hypothetical protein
LEMPNRLYMMTETVMTTTYGKPSAKYSEGTQLHGERAFIMALPECTGSFMQLSGYA